MARRVDPASMAYVRKSPQLFETPRPKRRVMMHVVDASEEHGGMIRMACKRCGHHTGWLNERSVKEERRGEPCPNCNGED